MPVCIVRLFTISYNSRASHQKHYCDYCDVYLTHDSASGELCAPFVLTHHLTAYPPIVRKAHNSGRNHLANVRDYYACVYN